MSPNLAVVSPAPLVLPPLSVRFVDAPDYRKFLAWVGKNRDLWLAVDRQAVVPEEFVARARTARRAAHLLVLAEDWCGDAVNTLPWLGRLAERLPGVDLKILPRDTNADLMDAHLTGTSRSIPVLIVYDTDWNELGWWGPRPATLQEWVLEHGMAMDKDERYREVRKWYARDRGRSILEEVVALLESMKRLPDRSLDQVTESSEEVEQRPYLRKLALAPVHRDINYPPGIIARSPAMRRLIDMARRIAGVDSTILITGESGTGKERIARFVHENSTRAKGPFIAVNCSAITETLLESELFGHARGSFTGAVQNRPGLLESANKGSILLDEIGEVPTSMQVKLLRVLQEREIRRVGENKSRPIDVRVIAATNRELTVDIAEGRFRKDLYYRLDVVELHVPPLRDRHEDILPLARQLLAEATIRLRQPIEGLSPRAADQLLRYSWPGNVRELENAMERAVALASMGRIEFEDLPEQVRRAIPAPHSHSGPVRSLEEMEKNYILAVLELNGGHQSKTADQLHIGPATLYRKLKRYCAGRRVVTPSAPQGGDDQNGVAGHPNAFD